MTAAEPLPYSFPAARISASASRYHAERQPEIDEPGTRDLRPVDVGERRGELDEVLGDRTRRLLARAREAHRGVGRVVAVRRVSRTLEHDLRARCLAERRLEPLDRLSGHGSPSESSRRYRTGVDEDDPTQERQLNIQIAEEHLSGVYANFANISFSDYEFTLTFARIDHEVSEGDIPGMVVARVNMSTKFAKELLDAMQDSWSKYATVRGIQDLPEAPPRNS